MNCKTLKLSDIYCGYIIYTNNTKFNIDPATGIISMGGGYVTTYYKLRFTTMSPARSKGVTPQEYMLYEFSVRVNSIDEMKTLHEIIRRILLNKKDALLYLKSDQEHLKTLAQTKLDNCQDVPIELRETQK